MKDIILHTFKVTSSTTLLEFLLKKLNQSRNNTKNILKRKLVLLNGLLVTQFNLELSKDDVITILKYPRNEVIKKQNKKYIKPPFKIIYNDNDFIAITKPIGTLSEFTDNNKESCFTILQNYLFNFDKNLRIYPLHRLDYETSGVLLFAKNKKVHTQLKLKWNELVLERSYCFITNGLLKKDLTIESYLEKLDNDLMKISSTKTDILAITHYKILKQTNKYTLGLAYLKTGKKHQIRVQLAYLNNPILGDKKYAREFKDPLKRLCLHAYRLVLKHPFTNEIITIESKVPDTFLNLVNYKN